MWGFIIAALSGLGLVASKKKEEQNYTPLPSGAVNTGLNYTVWPKQLTREDVDRIAVETVFRHFPYLNPLMLRAVAEIESSRQPYVERYERKLNDYSPGLMQVLTKTAMWLYADLRYDDIGIRPDRVSLKDPYVSMYFGAAYLEYLRKLFRGDEQKMIRAYNGGPGGINLSQTAVYWNKYLNAKNQLMRA